MWPQQLFLLGCVAQFLPKGVPRQGLISCHDGPRKAPRDAAGVSAVDWGRFGFMKKKLQNWREFTILIILEGRESLHLDSIPSRDVFFSDLGLEEEGEGVVLSPQHLPAPTSAAAPDRCRWVAVRTSPSPAG